MPRLRWQPPQTHYRIYLLNFVFLDGLTEDFEGSHELFKDAFKEGKSSECDHILYIDMEYAIYTSN